MKYVRHSAVIVLGAPSGKHEDWGWVSFFASNSYRMPHFVKKALNFFSLVWHTKMSTVFWTGQSTNSMAWKLAKWAKFVLVLTNTHMLKKLRIFVNRISNARQTTSNWIVRILNQTTSAVNYLNLTLAWNILIFLFVFIVFNTASQEYM